MKRDLVKWVNKQLVPYKPEILTSKDLPRIIKKAHSSIHWADVIPIEKEVGDVILGFVPYYLIWKGGGHESKDMVLKQLNKLRKHETLTTWYETAEIAPKFFIILYNDLAPIFGNNLYAIYASGDILKMITWVKD